jgi:hypothetical protein
MIKIFTFGDNVIRAVALWIMMAVGILPAGCSAPNEYVEYKTILSHKFQERQGPAKITRDNVKILESKGYYELGSISAFYQTSAGEEKKASGKLEEMLLKEAARQGGDLVLLNVENQPKSEKKAIRDKCIAWGEDRRVCSRQQVPTSVCVGSSLLNCRTEWLWQNVCRYSQECLSWQYRYETIAGMTSSGTVWRYDLDMKHSKIPPSDSSKSAEEAANKFSALPRVEKTEPVPRIKSSHIEAKVLSPPVSSIVKEEKSANAQSAAMLPGEEKKQKVSADDLPAITPSKITTKGKYAVQIKAYPEKYKNEAMVFVEDMQKKQPDIHMERVTLPGRGVWYRIMIGHFASADDARRYMEEKKIIDAHPGSFVQLKSAGQSSGMQNP